MSLKGSRVNLWDMSIYLFSRRKTPALSAYI
jgi:hypothetical protein